MRIDPPDCRCADCLIGYSRPSMLYDWVQAVERRQVERDNLAELLDELEATHGPIPQEEIDRALAMWPDSAYPSRTCCDSVQNAQHRENCPQIIGAAFGWNLGYEAGERGHGKFRNPFDPQCPACNQPASSVTARGTVIHNGCPGGAA